MSALPDFPPGAVAQVSSSLGQRGIALRPGVAADMPFLRDLYRQLRADELASLPWPDTQKHAFLDSQFALQHRHYLTHFPHADFFLIDYRAAPVGRLYLLRDAAAFLIVDISLAPAWRNSGIGSALIDHTQALAQAAGVDVNLHVDQRNAAAQRLYTRLGFSATGVDGPYINMRWSAALSAKAAQSS